MPQVGGDHLDEPRLCGSSFQEKASQFLSRTRTLLAFQLSLDARLHPLGEEQSKRVAVARCRAQEGLGSRGAAPIREPEAPEKHIGAASLLAFLDVGGRAVSARLPGPLGTASSSPPSSGPAVLDVGDEHLAPVDVDVPLVRHRLQLALDQLVQVVGEGHAAELLQGRHRVVARVEEDLLVVDVDADRGAVVLEPVAAVFVTAVPVRLVTRAGTFGNGVHYTSFCRQQGDAYRKGLSC